ncbi:DUF2244 domain-containing protein [Thalassospira mesophila]|uniref:DUF2244 domain-containing protein n=1 Tax=Thalassospira mesophila TaxID=1293891 RepID=UPI000A1E3B46|nr:DUF2244 domain-containing protein [Thalassospira mesophila]
MANIPRTEKPVFKTDLHPQRSLTRRGARRLVLCVGGVTTSLGVLFWSMGAWPIAGFMGIDVALLSFAFHLNFQSARRGEMIELRRSVLRLTRISARGVREEFDFQTYWVQVVMTPQDATRSILVLRSHGRDMEIAPFLGEDAKQELANTLREKLLICRGGMAV